MDMMRFNDFYLRLYRADPEQDGQALLDEFYALWREAEQSGVDAETLLEEAKGCIRKIATPEWFARAACDWIGSKGHYRLSKALTHEVAVQYFQHPKLLRFTLSGYSEKCAAMVARRLCALDAPVVVTLGWVLSINEDLAHSPLISSTTATVLGFLAVEHPATCKRLLEVESSPLVDSPLALHLAERLTSELRELEALPHLAELQMPSEMRRSFRYMRRNESRAVTEQARDDSFLADMFMLSEHFKYSHQVAVEYQNDQGTVETMIPMFTHEMSVELPQTWTADPLFYSHLVHQLWEEPSQ
ncbi:hypothetical protein [Pseudomonas sp. H1_G08]